MSFNLGKPILVMLVISLLSGVAVSLRPGQTKADLTIWVFADSHYKPFQSLVEKFSKENHVSVNLNLLSGRAEVVRLGQLFMSDPNSEQIPDLVEMEIGLVGRFFRPPVEEVGFLPLNDRLKQSGWYDRIVQTRFAPWSKEGQIFGVPHDVHPCTITYREDLFREAGIDLAEATTWPAFQTACEKFEAYWRARGYRYRHALELAEGSSDDLQKLLLQRGINPIDSFGNVHLQEPKVAQTLAFYAQMVAGKHKISAQTPAGNAALTRDLEEGNICAFITPDWRITYIKKYGAGVAGKMRMMPMPVFDPADTPTTTWGGTMIGITRACRNKELAWKLLAYLYFSEDGFRARQKFTDILPPIKSMWADASFHESDPFFGGQRGAQLFTELAAQIPARYVTPATPMATMALNNAVVRAVDYLESHGPDGLEAHCQIWLGDIAADLKSRMSQWSFDK
jgi:arabinosaccharide transport system substrate-binding protein